MPPDPDDPKEWMKKAESDARSARALLSLDPPEVETARLHIQQSIEKQLKAVLVAREQTFPFTHDIRKLINLLLPGTELESLAETLISTTVWAIEMRYPGFPAPPPQTVERAARAMDQLFAWSLTQIGKK